MPSPNSGLRTANRRGKSSGLQPWLFALLMSFAQSGCEVVRYYEEGTVEVQLFSLDEDGSDIGLTFNLTPDVEQGYLRWHGVNGRLAASQSVNEGIAPPECGDPSDSVSLTFEIGERSGGEREMDFLTIEFNASRSTSGPGGPSLGFDAENSPPPEGFDFDAPSRGVGSLHVPEDDLDCWEIGEEYHHPYEVFIEWDLGDKPSRTTATPVSPPSPAPGFTGL